MCKIVMLGAAAVVLILGAVNANAMGMEGGNLPRIASPYATFEPSPVAPSSASMTGGLMGLTDEYAQKSGPSQPRADSQRLAASAETAEVAKKCEALTIKAYPFREPGNPAAGSAKGDGLAAQRYFSRCVANGGNMSMGLDPGTPSQAAGGNALQIGDLVQFPLGGPVMKVIDIQNDNVICQWTTDAGQVVSGTLPTVALTATGDSGGLKDQQENPHYTYRPCPASVFMNGKHLCL